MTYDWKKEFRDIIYIIVGLFLLSGFLFFTVSWVVGVKYVHIIRVLIIHFIITPLALWFFYIGTAINEIDADKYKKLQDKANNLAEKGYPEFKEEVKKLIEISGEIKGYQYDKFMEDFESLEKDLVIKAIRRDT